MSVITQVKPQKNQKRLNIYIDNKFSFGIDLQNFVELKLKVGQEISEEDISKIVKKAEFQKTLDKLLKFAMTRPKSEKEFKDYLKRKKVPETLHSDLFERLKYFDLLDDVKFAKWWVEQRITFNKKTKKVIEQELIAKGVASETIKEALSEFKFDELSLAKDLVNKKMYKWQKYDGKAGVHERIKKQKISQYLLGKGFDWNVINNVLKLPLGD